MKWFPTQPISSTVKPRLNVQDYKKDLAFDFEKGDFTIVQGDLKTVSGLDNFIQKVQKFILTPKSNLWSYGFEHKLFEVTSEDDFKVEAESLAKQLVSQVLKDSSQENPSGLGHTIESIHSIEKTVKDGRDWLLIKMKVSGLNNLIEIPIPFPSK